MSVSNGQVANAATFNAAFLSRLTSTLFTLANAHATADIDDLIVDKNSNKAGFIFAEVRRKTDTAASELVGIYMLIPRYLDESSDWDLIEQIFGDDCGVTFDIDSDGQVTYATTSIAGANYVGTMKYKWMVF